MCDRISSRDNLTHARGYTNAFKKLLFLCCFVCALYSGVYDAIGKETHKVEAPKRDSYDSRVRWVCFNKIYEEQMINSVFWFFILYSESLAVFLCVFSVFVWKFWLRRKSYSFANLHSENVEYVVHTPLCRFTIRSSLEEWLDRCRTNSLGVIRSSLGDGG